MLEVASLKRAESQGGLLMLLMLSHERRHPSGVLAATTTTRSSGCSPSRPVGPPLRQTDGATAVGVVGGVTLFAPQ
jgi:hypothetical protein